MILQTQVGPQTLSDGNTPTLRSGKSGEGIFSELNGRYYENTYRGNKYAASVGGAGQVLVAANLFSTAIGTFQPIIALFNPAGSGKNLVLLQSWVGVTADPVSAGVTGGFYLVGQAGQPITNSASVVPINTGTLKQLGSVAIPVLNVVLAGAVGNPILIRPVSSTLVPVAQPATANSLLSEILMDDIGGSLIVPPGGYVGLANGISNTTATVAAGFVWDELSI